MAKKNGVYINVDMDTKQAEKSASKVNGALRNMAATAKAVRDEIGKSLKKGFQDSIVDDKSVKTTSVLDAGINELQEQLQKLQDRYDNLVEAKKLFLEAGGSEDTDTFKGYANDMDLLAEKIDTVKDKILDIDPTAFGTIEKEVERATTPKENVTDEYKALQQELARLEAKLIRVNESKERFLATGGKENSNTYKKYEYDLESLSNKISLVKDKMAQMEDSGEAFEKGDSKLKKLLGTMKKTTSAIGSMVKGYGKLKDAIGSRFHKSMNDTNKGFIKGLKTMIRYGIGVRSLFALINRVRSGVVEGFNNLAKVDSQTRNSLNSLKSSLTLVKNSLATAFSPILNVIAPIISRFCDMLADAAAQVAMFFVTLTGQSVIKKAIKQQESFGDATEKSNEATKEQTKQLAAYDKLSVINNDKGNGSNSGGGSGGGVGGFESVDVSGAPSEFAKLVKEAWEKADFTEVGRIIGNKLKESLESIPWEDIQETAGKVGKSLGTLITGFVETPELGTTIGESIGNLLNTGLIGATAFVDNTSWESVGKFFGDGLNGIIDTIDWLGWGKLFAKTLNAKFTTIKWFFKTTDWKNLGDSLAESLIGFFETFDIKNLGDTVGSVLKGIFDVGTGFLDGIDWSKVPQAIVDKIVGFFKGLDESGLAQAIADFITAAVKGIGALIGGIGLLIFNAIKDEFEKCKNEYESLGDFIINGLWEGIKKAIANVGKWILDNIFKPFIDGFKSAFDIHSPSKVMEEQGKYIIDGLLNGIKNNIKAIVDKFGELKDNVISKLKSLKSEGVAKFDSLKDSLVTSAENIKTKVSTAFTNLKNSTKSIFNGIKKVIKSPINTILTYIQKMINGVVSGMNTVINALNKFKINSPKWFKKLTGIGSIGFNLSPIKAPNIPKLAEGAVIPANKQFLAMLGDQKHGTNIETPLDTMIEAFKIALNDEGQKGQTINVNLDGKKVAQVVWEEQKKRYKQTGYFTPAYSS